MYKLYVLLAVLFAGAAAQSVATPRVHWFGDIDATDLFKAPNDMTNAASQWQGPLDPPMQKPQSYRTYTVCFNPQRLNGVDFFNIANRERQMTIVFEAPHNVATTYEYKLEAPYLEVDPWQCAEAVTTAGVTSALPQQTGNCRCNQPTTVNTNNANPTRPYVVAGSTMSTATSNPVIGVNSRNVTIDIPNWTYFEHAPFPGQNPYMRTYRKLCWRRSVGAAPVDTIFTDTTIWIAVVHCCDHTNAGANTKCTDTATNTALSYSWNKATLTDATIDAQWICNKPGWLGEFFDFAANPQPVSLARSLTAGVTADAGSWDGNMCWGETKEMALARQARTACCGARANGVADGSADARTAFNVFGLTVAGNPAGSRNGQKYGTCYNPQVEQCCGWKAYNPKSEKCCSKQYARVNYVDQFCKCDSANELGDCQRQGSNKFTTANDLRGESDVLSTADSAMKCCVESKYPDLANMRKFGVCYDSSTTAGPYRCCTDGHVYDEGSQQCCPINGVQSLNVPCPCSTNADCNIGTTVTKACCLQQFPKTWMDGQAPNSVATLQTVGVGAGVAQSNCDKYSNWPTGSAPIETQRCAGSCFDLKFQTCCNGQLCTREFERCCNSTCCNRFTSGCVEGSKAGTWGFGSRVNPNNFKVAYEVCTSTEVFTTRRAFWVWVMPTFWLIATFAALAVVTVVARRAVENVFEITERAMVFFAVLLIGLAVPHYFSPTYKYGIVLAFVALFALLGAVMRSKRMSLLVVFLVLLVLLYWLDPFEGNIFLSFTGGASPATSGEGVSPFLNVNGNYASGIVEALFRLERNRTECTGFYDFFMHDPNVHDFARFRNPQKMTFGFCTRAWNAALLIFSIVSLFSILILLLLSIFSFTKQLLPDSEDEEEDAFEVQPAEYAY
eukprot:NODE_250_length_2832_cov_214.312661_g234_i0.p1 GENE.NODE_250_length_2832_cov_214.312661_g234_i0~~NODE_250_length_2832_cov_214.312661_g234_i0.p1  ORF type:complete len:908 (-),score=288.60 NODE_250_length_2832_cov_214.312661_g234_i0:108-2801(-)